MLWRIEYFVEGKDLEKALTGAAGIALNMSTPQPVSGAMVITSGRTKQVKSNTTPIDGSFKDRMITWLQTFEQGHRITSKQMRKYFLEELGGNKNSYNHGLMKSLIDAGVLKRISRGQYTIVSN